MKWNRLILTCLLTVAAHTVDAATISWNAVQTATGTPADVVTTGTFVDSATIFAGADVTLNGVTFKRRTSGGASTAAFSGSGITVSNVDTGYFNFGSPPVTWDANYQTLGSWTALDGTSSGVMTITLSGLTNGQQYLVQLWETYWNNPGFTTNYVAGNDSGPLNVGFSNSTVSQYVTGAFTATGTTQSISATSGGNFAFVGFMQVRAVPEPGGLSLLAIGGVYFWFRQRRQRI